jgi:NADPH:quinone reductase-like Zn-dependent oxidoreductase
VQAITYTRYGTPEELHLEELPRPVPEDDAVLIRVHAASINSWDQDLLRGRPFLTRLAGGGLRAPRKPILGADVAGTVEAVGRDVTSFQPGDEVFGDISGAGWGGFAEYVAPRANVLAKKPPGLTFEDAAALPQAGVLALQGLRAGHIEAGKHVLFNGAGGGVGTLGIQIARSLGTEVAGIDRAEKLDLLRSLGADPAIDFTTEDVTTRDERYDLVLDVMASRSFRDWRRVLRPGGRYVMVGGTTPRILETVTAGSLVSLFGSRRYRLLMHRPNARDLAELGGIAERGELSPVIDRTVPLAEVPEAMRYFATGQVRGKIVVTV